MKTTIAIITFLFSMSCLADTGFYIGGGLGTYYPVKHCREICFKTSIVANAQFGYTFRPYNKVYIDIGVTHISDPTVKDRGGELFLITGKKYFK